MAAWTCVNAECPELDIPKTSDTLPPTTEVSCGWCGQVCDPLPADDGGA